MPRVKVVRLQGQSPKRYYNNNGKSTKKVLVDAPDESAGIAQGRWGLSKYWQIRLDECDKFSEVKVYDGQGKLLRVIPRPELNRPLPKKQGWNTVLFPSSR